MASRKPPSPTIRQYRHSDNAQVWALAALSTTRTADGREPPLPLPPATEAPADCPDLTDIARTFLKTGGDFLVAEVGGELVGTAGLLLSGDKLADVVRVRVHPSARRRGVGTALLEAIEWRAEGLGIRRLNLDVGDNQRDAIAFYLASGFRNLDDDEDPSNQEWDTNFFTKALKVMP